MPADLTVVPLLAALDWVDILRALIPLVLLVIWVVSQVTAGKAKGQPARKVPPRARMRPADPQPERPPGGDFSGEIEEFLRKAAQRREGQKPEAAVPVRQHRPEQPVAEARRETPRPAAAAARKPLAAPPVAQLARPRDQKKPARATPMGQERLETHRIGDRPISSLEQSSSLASHVSQVFDHTVGRLASRDLISDAETAAGPAEVQRPAVAPITLAVLLSNPQNLQQAVILNEILQRPEHRW